MREAIAGQDALSRYPRLRAAFVENVARLFVEAARLAVKPGAAGPDEILEALLQAAGRLAREHDRGAELAKQLRELADVLDPSGSGGADLKRRA